MIRAEYWEATRLATIDDRVGYEWQSATGRLVVSYVLAIGKNSFHMQREYFSLGKSLIPHIFARKPFI